MILLWQISPVGTGELYSLRFESMQGKRWHEFMFSLYPNKKNTNNKYTDEERSHKNIKEWRAGNVAEC